MININDMLKNRSMEGNIEKVKEAIKSGADIYDDDSISFRLACINGHMNIVELFLEIGDNSLFKKSNDRIKMMMMFVIKNGHNKIFKYLVEKGFIGMHVDKIFLYSCKFNNVEIVDCLIKYGANVHVEDNEALKSSVMLGNLEVVKYLKNLINIDNYKDEMLIAACRNNRPGMVDYLISNGADVKSQDNLALMSTNNLKIIKSLISAGVDIHAQNELTLIKIGSNGDIEGLKYLIEQHDCNIHAQDDEILKKTLKNLVSPSKILQKRKDSLIEVAKLLIEYNKKNALIDKIIEEYACEYMSKYYFSKKTSEHLEQILNLKDSLPLGNKVKI